MEPMAVSPGKSPSHNGQYLPSFLLGELASPLSGGMTSSPIPSAANYSSRGSRTKLEGPPIVGLFDEINSSPPQSPNSNNTSYLASLHNSTAFLDASCLENQENRNFWVVVFGFPPAQVSQIIALFSQLGRVVEHNYPVNANWVCISYSNQSDMRKALSMNAKVLSGNVMIGVTERKQQLCKREHEHCYVQICRIHDIPSSTPISQSPQSTSFLSPLSKDKVGSECATGASSTVNTSLANVSIATPTSPKIRPLALSKRQNVAQSPGNTGPVPTADTSLVGKFMDFIFSW